MSAIGKLVFAMLMFGIANTILFTLGGDLWGSSGSSLSYQDANVSDLQRNVTGAPADSSGSSVLIRIFDYITLGYLKKVISFIDGALFALPNVLNTTGLVPADMWWLTDMMRIGLTLMYVLYAIELYTGRNFTND
jgi:hypothetical protein